MRLARGERRSGLTGLGLLPLAGLMLVGTPARAQDAARDADSRSPALKVTDQGCEQNDRLITDSRSGTGMVGLINCWEANATNGSYRALTDLYAHWIVTRLDTDVSIRYYAGEERPALLRLFVGRDRSFVSSIKIQMHDPDQSVTIPLVTFGYQGKVGKGQSWTTDVVSDDQSQPYFRIGPSTSATINVTARAADDVEVRATGVILSTLRSISTIVTPGGSLVTALNREPLNQASTAIDNALGNVWSKTKDERQISGRQLSEWYESAGFVIEVYVPKFVRAYARNDDADGAQKGTAIGTKNVEKRVYLLRLSCPRYSVFDPAQACRTSLGAGDQPTQPYNAKGISSDFFTGSGAARLRARITAQQVLNFPLSQGQTISQFLAGHAWYTQFLRMGDPAETTEDAGSAGAKSGAKQPTRTPADYAGLCSQIVDALYSVGLSSFDARVGLWATITGSSDFVNIRGKFADHDQCTELLPQGADNASWRFDLPK